MTMVQQIYKIFTRIILLMIAKYHPAMKTNKLCYKNQYGLSLKVRG